MPYWFFLLYLKLPSSWKMRLYWCAMRRKQFYLAWNMADHMDSGEDDTHYLLKLAANANNSGEIR